LEGENSQTYYFGSSTITVGKISEMVEKGYFLESKAHAPGDETVPEPDNDEAVVYEDFFLLLACTCLYIQLWLIFYYISRHNCIS
jgi:hypothetical protein